MPSLLEITSSAEDEKKWDPLLTKWGKGLMEDSVKQEPRVNKLPKGKSNFVYSNMFDYDSRVFIIHTDDGAPCGYIAIQTHSHNPFLVNAKPTMMSVNELYIAEEHRRQGIASWALRQVEEMAKKNKDIFVLQIQLYAKNAPADKAYEKFGFSDWSKTKVKFLR